MSFDWTIKKSHDKIGIKQSFFYFYGNSHKKILSFMEIEFPKFAILWKKMAMYKS